MPAVSTSQTPRRHVLAVALLLAAQEPLTAESGWDAGELYLQAGAYAHFRDSDDYEGPPVFGSVEVHRPGGGLWGLGLFNNSFGQFCQYAYFGWELELPKVADGLHLKLTGGLVHGYRGEFQDKIPFNGAGVAPAIVPGIGFRGERWGGDLALLGDAGLLFLVGYRFSAGGGR